MKALKTKLEETSPERVAGFEKDAAAFAKKVVTNFKDYEFVGLLSNIPFDSNESSPVYGRVDESRWYGCFVKLSRMPVYSSYRYILI